MHLHGTCAGHVLDCVTLAMLRTLCQDYAGLGIKLLKQGRRGLACMGDIMPAMLLCRAAGKSWKICSWLNRGRLTCTAPLV